MAPTISITGDKQLDKRLRSLQKKGAARVARSAVGKGLTVIRKGIVAAVPKATTPGHSNASIRKSIGKRFGKAKAGENRGQVQAKAGVDVGKKKAVQARQAHLLAAGTVMRVRKRIGGKFAYADPRAKSRSTGRIKGSEFVKAGFNASEGAAMAAIVEAAKEALAKEALRTS